MHESGCACPECLTARVEDAETIMQLTAEMLRKTTTMELVLRPDSVFHLVAMLQLAKRHGDLPEHSRALADTFIAGAREYFADCPTVLDVIERGDDPTQDRRK